MTPETAIESAILENGIGMYAICAESDRAVFTAKGPIPHSLQILNTQVWNEWAQSIKTMYEIGSSSLEIYSAGDPKSQDYEYGIRVPIKKKADLKICQSCGMPVGSEEMSGTNADGSINTDYCKHCYTDGEFTDKLWMK